MLECLIINCVVVSLCNYKNIFLFLIQIICHKSSKSYAIGTQKNGLNEIPLYSTLHIKKSSFENMDYGAKLVSFFLWSHP